MPPLDLPFHLLTETEKACLRLVGQGQTSRQIAAERGVRFDRIDKILRVARTKLNQPTRHEAARRLAEYEVCEAQAPIPVAHMAQGLVPPAQSVGAQSLGLDQSRDTSIVEALDPSNTGNTDDALPPSAARWLDLTDGVVIRRLLFGSQGSLRNGLDSWSRTVAICVIAAVAACAAAAIFPLLIVIDRIAIAL
jgi:DNA-binding CsgD family transcriptional regulator